jgi:hypothetical protein
MAVEEAKLNQFLGQEEDSVSTATTPARAARQELAEFEGRLIGPDDPDYEQARRVYNAMIDKRPALIAQCTGPHDVARTIAFARAHNLPLAVRGGGHNGAGLGTCDGGVVIDLSPLKRIQVDPQAHTVRVSGGCTWGEVDAATGKYGLATPSGIISTTGVGGLTLGGGLGHLTRKCGLAIDNLLRRLGEDAAAAMAPFLQALPAPLLHAVGPMPHAALQSAFDGLYPPGDQWYWRADFVKEIPDEAVELHARFGAEMPTMKSTMHLYPIDGAAHDLGPGDTAWSYRDAVWGSVFAGVDADPANADVISRWSIDYFEALHPYSAGGAYVNMMMEEGEERVRAAYRDNYQRLAKLKAKYDPDNLFRVNQNIVPAA